jgi:hypothetical protein
VKSFRIRLVALTPLVVAGVGCSPPLVWGGDQAVKHRLFNIVPTGSSPETLEAAAKNRGWTITARDERHFAPGTPTYFEDNQRKCAFVGGPSRVVTIAHYWSPLETYVESYWLYDTRRKLRDICIRRDVDSL